MHCICIVFSMVRSRMRLRITSLQVRTFLLYHSFGSLSVDNADIACSPNFA